MVDVFCVVKMSKAASVLVLALYGCLPVYVSTYINMHIYVFVLHSVAGIRCCASGIVVRLLLFCEQWFFQLYIEALNF